MVRGCIKIGDNGGALENLANEKRQNVWAIFSHLSIIFLPILGPIITLLVVGNDNRFIEKHSKEALNLHITAFIAGVAVIVITFVLTISLIGILLLPLVFLVSGVLGLYWLFSAIRAAVSANRGEDYTYKFVFRLF